MNDGNVGTEDAQSIFCPKCDDIIIPSIPIAKNDFCPGCKTHEWQYTDLFVKSLLHSPEFFDKILKELSRRVAGEEKQRRAITLWSFMRLVQNRDVKALMLLVNGPPSCGKDHVTRAVVELHPQKLWESYRAGSPAVFDYLHKDDEGFSWEDKLLRLGDISNALINSEAFKTFLSDDEAAVKVNKTKAGANTAEVMITHGKPVVIATTANANPNAEALNRANIIELTETDDQTGNVVWMQLLNSAGKGTKPRYSAPIKRAIEKLQQVSVVVPYAEKLYPHLPKNEVRLRRDVPRFLMLIKASAAVFQFQRQRDDKGNVLAEAQDYENAREAISLIKTGQFANLSRHQRRAYQTVKDWDAVKGNEGRSFTSEDLYAFKPEVSERQYRTHLEKLAEEGLLTAGFEKNERTGRSSLHYVLVPGGLRSISLPCFEDLDKPPAKASNTSITSKTTITSITSNTSKTSITSTSKPLFEVNEVIEVRKRVGEDALPEESGLSKALQHVDGVPDDD